MGIGLVDKMNFTRHEKFVHTFACEDFEGFRRDGKASIPDSYSHWICVTKALESKVDFRLYEVVPCSLTFVKFEDKTFGHLTQDVEQIKKMTFTQRSDTYYQPNSQAFLSQADVEMIDTSKNATVGGDDSEADNEKTYESKKGKKSKPQTPKKMIMRSDSKNSKKE